MTRKIFQVSAFFGITAFLLFGYSASAFGEELPAEEPVVEETAPEPAPAEEPVPVKLPQPVLEPDLDPVPEPESNPATTESGYTPPPDALEGLGAWSVVSPSTGEIHTTVPFDGTKWSKDFIEGWEERNQARFCSDCTLRYQAKASDTGNVAGYGSSSGATYDGDDKATFTVEVGSGTATLVPEKTESQGGNIGAGLTDIRTKDVLVEEEEEAVVETFRSSLSDNTTDIKVSLPTLGGDGTILEYNVEVQQPGLLSTFLERVPADVEDALEENATEEEPVQAPGTNPDQPNTFVDTIRQLTQDVVSFLGSLFGI